MSKVSKSFFLFFLFIALLVSFSCNKSDLQWDLPRTNSLDSVQTSVGPTLSTIVASSVSQYTATSGGASINDNGSPITEKGVCWSTNSNPTVSDSHTSDGTGTADFSSQLTGLNSNTQYYVRAYATNSAGTGYGSNVVLTTTTNPIATISTSSVTNIGQQSANCGGTIISNGGSAITSSGICWSIAVNPTVSDANTSSGSSSGSFVSKLSNLNPSTTYYVRAYATTAFGTAYGENKMFTTLSAPLATLTTASVTNISQNSATSGGTIVSNGGAAVTASGICWSTVSNPTINNSHTSNGPSSGSFQSQLTNLNPSTTYCVRAYATTSAGTGYGQSVTFTTSDIPTPTAVGTESCSDLSNVAVSIYYGMNGTNDNWGISTNGYSGACWVAPDPNNGGALGTTVGNMILQHYIQFNRTFNNSGYFEFWIKTPNGQGGTNIIPTILIDGTSTIGTTVIGGQTPGIYWLKLRTDLLSAGWHNISIQFAGSYHYFFVDEITFFEYQ